MRRSPHRRRSWQLPVLVATVALLLAACNSSFTYVKNSETRTFFKVPNHWRLFGEDEIFASGGLSPQGEEAAKAALWVVAFDADPRPTLENMFEAEAQWPQGFAQVRPLTDAQRDTFSLASLRNLVFPIDQLAAQDPGSVELLQSEDLVLEGGFRGNRLLFNVQREGSYYTVNQTGLVDATTQRVYLFVIGCEAHCYLDNQRTIDQIVDSWTVEER